MNFAVEYRDIPNSGELRKSHRDAHIAYRKGLGDALLLAGPLLDDAGQSPVGSLVILSADNLAAATALAQKDPYVAAGLFSSVKVTPYKIMLANIPRPGP